MCLRESGLFEVSEVLEHLKSLNYLDCLKKPGDSKMSEMSVHSNCLKHLN